MELVLESNQITPVEYLVRKCKNQHGLILNHYMGTGKTLTAISFLKNYPDDKKTIIVPEGLINNWKTVIRKMKLTNFKIVSLESLVEKFNSISEYIKNSVCVIDEAHNIVEIVNEIKRDKDTNDFLKSKKYTDPRFDKMIEKLKERPDIKTFLETMYKTKKILLLTGTLITNKRLDNLAWMVNLAAGKTILPFDRDNFEEKFIQHDKNIQLIFGFLIPLIRLNFLNIIPKQLFNSFSSLISEDDFSGIGRFLVSKTKDEIINSFSNPLDISVKQSFASNSKKYLNELLFSVILTKGLQYMIEKISIFYSLRYSYDKYDIKKLKEAGVDKYISYYRYSDNDNYPKTIRKSMNVSYTDEQMILFFRFLLFPANLKSSEYVDLGLSENELDAEFYKPETTDHSGFTFLGNLYEEPIKFVKIVNMFLKNNKPTIVYSNFHEKGLLLFSKYLDKKKVKHAIYDKDSSDNQKNKMIKDFESGKNKFLLLHKSFYEGFSINGCRVFHILEPLDDFEKHEQLITRAVRYKSHAHLPLKERNVEIYQWYCSLRYDKNKFKKSKKYLEILYKEKNSQTKFDSIVDAFDFFDSPDDTIMIQNEQIGNFEESFNDAIRDLSIEYSKKS